MIVSKTDRDTVVRACRTEVRLSTNQVLVEKRILTSTLRTLVVLNDFLVVCWYFPKCVLMLIDVLGSKRQNNRRMCFCLHFFQSRSVEK